MNAEGIIKELKECSPIRWIVELEEGVNVRLEELELELDIDDLVLIYEPYLDVYVTHDEDQERVYEVIIKQVIDEEGKDISGQLCVSDVEEINKILTEKISWVR